MKKGDTLSTKTVTELIAEGLDDGGFRAEHALAVAMADASPALKAACEHALRFTQTCPNSAARDALLAELRAVLESASTPAARAAH